LGEFAKQNKALQLSRNYDCKCDRDMEWRLLFLLGEICLSVGSGKASAKAATKYSNIRRDKQKSAETIVAEY